MGISRRLEEARRAFRSGDRDATVAAHQPDRIERAAREEHGGSGHQYVGDMVYGGLDGIITTFAVVSGVAGAELGTPVILILGLANLFADGFSMGVGAILSLKSEKEYYDRERQREAWEVDHYPEGERKELHEIYRARGYTEEEAGTLVQIQTRDRERWVQAMMVDELRLLPDDRKPIRSGLTTFVAFAVAGVVPLLVYLLALMLPVPPGAMFPVSIVLTGLTLFALGAAKVRVTGLSAWRSGLEMLAVGGLAAAVAYGVGALLKGLAG